MMLERDFEFVANSRQVRWIDSEVFAGQLNGTFIAESGWGQQITFAAGVEHFPIERSVVGDDKIYSVEERGNFGPNFSEQGSLFDVLPGDSMDVGENKISIRGLDKVVFLDHNLF
jgi:hypothetical protein